jgi:hypothetical protein
MMDQTVFQMLQWSGIVLVNVVSVAVLAHIVKGWVKPAR